jgi:8-oxo-dGTP pyrophosphatase MutT (NUDIX family)
VSLHDDASRVLGSWQAPDADQSRLRDVYLAHLAEFTDGVWRSRTEGHITASAVIVEPSARRVLLTLHPKVGLWLQTGGHCEESDASLAGAALREAVEESGIAELELLPEPVALDRHEVRCGGPDSWSVHYDVEYVAVAPPEAVARLSDESLDLRWFGYDDLPTLTDEAVRTLVSRAAALVS